MQSNSVVISGCVQDSVSQTGKLFWLYKRSGQRVIINDRGDLIVRPSSLETRLEQIGSEFLPPFQG